MDVSGMKGWRESGAERLAVESVELEALFNEAFNEQVEKGDIDEEEDNTGT
jgi:hypothetical protein